MLLPRLGLLIGGFLFVLLIGLGPALTLVSRRLPSRILLACCVAPLVGLVELGIVLYPLVYADHPLNLVAVPAAVVLLLLSAILLGVAVQRDRAPFLALAERKRAIFLTVLLTAVCAAFVLFALSLPLIVSNLEYGLWQSSPWDATNYMLIAWHAQHLLWSYGANPSHYQDLLNINPALATIMAWFPHDRPVSAIVLGWFSTVLGVPVYYAYYPYKLLSLFCSFWVTLALCSLIGIRGWQRYMAATVIAVGFWGVFIVDIDASSQLNAIPLSLLFLFAWLQLELLPAQPQKIIRNFGREHGLFALSFAGLVAYYPEFIVLLSAALIAYYAFQILRRRAYWRVALNRGLTLGAGSLLLLPVLAPTLTFLQLQISHSTSPTGVSVTNAWAYDYRWLFQSARVVGIWGLSFYQSYGGTLVSAGVTIVGTLLTLVLMIGAALIIGRRRENSSSQIPAVAISVFWGIAILTYTLNMLWISGKAFAMGYPFAVLVLTLCVVRFSSWTQHTNRWRLLSRALSLLFVLWIVSQCGIFLVRTAFVSTQTKQPTDYVQLRWEGFDDIVPIITYLQQHPVKLLGSDFFGPNELQAATWSFMLNDVVNYLPMHHEPYFFGYPSAWAKESNDVPDALLLTRERDYLAGVGTAPVLIQNGSLTLYQVNADVIDESLARADLTRTDIPNALIPYNIDTQAKDGVSLVGAGSSLRFLASGQHGFVLTMNGLPAYDGKMTIALNGAPLQTLDVQANTPQTISVPFTPKSGTNLLTFQPDVSTPTHTEVIPFAGLNYEISVDEKLPRFKVETFQISEQSVGTAPQS